MFGSVNPQAHSRCFPPEFSTYVSHLISAAASLSSWRRNLDLQPCEQTTVTSQRPPDNAASSQRADVPDALPLAPGRRLLVQTSVEAGTELTRAANTKSSSGPIMVRSSPSAGETKDLNQEKRKSLKRAANDAK